MTGQIHKIRRKIIKNILRNWRRYFKTIVMRLCLHSQENDLSEQILYKTVFKW